MRTKKSLSGLIEQAQKTLNQIEIENGEPVKNISDLRRLLYQIKYEAARVAARSFRP